jgi:hypothetical protein
MAHAGVEAHGDVCTHPLHDNGRFLHPLFGDVKIDVAATEEYGRSRQRSLIFPGSAGWPDQPAAQPYHAAVTRRMAHHKLGGQASPLRKAQAA